MFIKSLKNEGPAMLLKGFMVGVQGNLETIKPLENEGSRISPGPSGHVRQV